MNYTFFWKTASPFSNWHPSKYVYRGVTFECVEQGMMYEKALLFDPTGPELEKILGTMDPKRIKQFGRNVKNFDEAIWVEHREMLVRPHLVAKFTQNPALATELLATDKTTIVEASPFDRIWGIGYTEENAVGVGVDKWGLNLLGKLLTSVREEICSRIP